MTQQDTLLKMEKLIKLNAELMKINATNQEEMKAKDKNLEDH